MAKERLINTRFWNDTWIRTINPLDRYLFIYLLTNEYTNISGIYELPLPTMAFGSGLDERDLEKTMLPRLEPKIYFRQGWVILVNFLKYQRLKSGTVFEGVVKCLKEVPRNIVIFAKSKGYGSDIDMIWESYHISESESESELKLEPESKNSEATASQEINEIISSFKEVNPSYKKFFANKTQRGAITRLLKENSKGNLLKIITLLPKSNTMKYMPVITTPLQLEDKYAQLAMAMKKYKDELEAKITNVAFF